MNKATEKQINYIKKLIERAGTETFGERGEIIKALAKQVNVNYSALDKQKASEIINALKSPLLKRWLKNQDLLGIKGAYTVSNIYARWKAGDLEVKDENVESIAFCLLEEISDRSEWFDIRYTSGFVNPDECPVEWMARETEIQIAKDIRDVRWENSFHRYPHNA